MGFGTLGQHDFTLESDSSLAVVPQYAAGFETQIVVVESTVVEGLPVVVKSTAAVV